MVSLATIEEVQSPQGKLIIDATVAEQAIRYPTDLSLLNEAWEITQKVIDALYPHTGYPESIIWVGMRFMRGAT